MQYNFKSIKPVPTAKDFVDIFLSKVQRKSPTVVHPSFKISRIRAFYMRKVKFAQDCVDEKLDAILQGFPKFDDLHPFYADLLNVLYDRDHFKLALGQIARCKKLIADISRDYVRLMKFADSLYRCKQLKKAALGRMATLISKQKDSLIYLEQVRMHLGRLPSIDPYTRTLIICGYPNVGKSSFMNKITNANVDVQPYAFTTKSLFVGHFDYRYLRWQVIDTPGVLDHPFEDRNTIEMLSITALAHLQSCILYFMDLSEQCGYTVEAQCKLFQSIKPLFVNKQTILVINKIDVTGLDDLDAERRKLVDEILESGVELCTLSCLTDINITETKSKACDILLAQRVDNKLSSNKVTDLKPLFHIAKPDSYDESQRPAFIPQAAIEKPKYDKNDPNRPILERDLEKENGGCGVYSVDLKKNYFIKDEEWKYDKIPEIIGGKNIADLVDPDIAAKLDALEKEEENLIANGFYNIPDEYISRKDAEALKSKQSEKDISRKRTGLKIKKTRLVGKKKFDKMLNDTKLKAKQKEYRSEDMDVSLDENSQKFTNTRKTRNSTTLIARNEIPPSQLNHLQQSLKQTRKMKVANVVAKPRHLFSGKRKPWKGSRR